MFLFFFALFINSAYAQISLQYSFVTGHPTPPSPPPTFSPTSFSSLTSVSFDLGEVLWAIDSSTNRFLAYNVTSQSSVTFWHQLVSPISGKTCTQPNYIAVDLQSAIWCSCEYESKVLKFTTSGLTVTSATLFTAFGSCSISNYVGGITVYSNGDLSLLIPANYEVCTVTTSTNSFVRSFSIVSGSYASGLAYDTTGNLFVTLQNGQVYKYTSTGTLVTTFTADPDAAYAIKINAQNEVYINTYIYGIRVFSTSGSLLRSYSEYPPSSYFAWRSQLSTNPFGSSAFFFTSYDTSIHAYTDSAATSQSPTLNPTPPTAAPTKSPTTLAPTSSPSLSGQPVLMRWRIAKNSLVTATYVSASTLTTTELAPLPINITKSSILIEAVYWENVTFQNTSQTGVVTTGFISLCNPVINPSPGSVDVVGPDGLVICPSPYRCVAAGATPNSEGVLTGWSSLRSCALSYTVVRRPEIPQQSVLTDAFLVGGTLVSTTTPRTNSYPSINCNSAIERELNCQFKRQLLTNYQLQCAAAPIACYKNNTLGYAFGLFWNQNPKYFYNVPLANWTENLYKGVASTMNFLVYSENGKLIDPWTPEVWDDYYWVYVSGILSSTTLTYNSFANNLPDIIQLQPYLWQWIARSPPPIYNTEDSTEAEACITYIRTYGSIPSYCYSLTYAKVLSYYWRLTAPSITYQLTAAFSSVEVLSATFNYTAIEIIYNGLHCGLGTNATTCFLKTEPGGNLTVRFLGAAEVWDLPLMRLTTALPDLVTTDPLYEYIDQGVFQNETFLSLPVGEAVLNNWLTAVDVPKYKPTSLSGLNLVLRFNSTSFSSFAFSNITDSILENNIYPYNYALSNRTILKDYDTRPCNLSSPTDQDYYYRIWSTWMSMRRASETRNCKTFGLGTVQYLSSYKPTQYWFQYPPADINYQIPPGSSEGGCDCAGFGDPFYDPLTFCSTCLDGFGVSTDGIIRCSLPYYADPIPGSTQGYCSNHGTVSIYDGNTPSVDVTAWTVDSAYWLIPTCTQIWLYFNSTTDILYLNTTVGGGFAWFYMSNNNFVTIINDEIYLNGQIAEYTVVQQAPFEPVVQSYGYTFYCYSPYVSTNSTLFGYNLKPAGGTGISQQLFTLLYT